MEDPPEDLYGLLERLDGKSRNSKPEDENVLFDTVGRILLSGRALLLYLQQNKTKKGFVSIPGNITPIVESHREHP